MSPLLATGLSAGLEEIAEVLSSSWPLMALMAATTLAIAGFVFFIAWLVDG